VEEPGWGGKWALERALKPEKCFLPDTGKGKRKKKNGSKKGVRRKEQKDGKKPTKQNGGKKETGTPNCVPPEKKGSEDKNGKHALKTFGRKAKTDGGQKQQ